MIRQSRSMDHGRAVVGHDTEAGMSAAFTIDVPEPQQSRSLATQRAFIDAGRALLQEMPWENLPVTLIAQRARRSVGVFYQRFGSREDFLTVLLNEWMVDSRARLDAPIAGVRPGATIEYHLTSLFERIRTNRHLWRAALQRAMNDPPSWAPFRAQAAAWREALASQVGERRGRPLDAAERHRLELAMQVFNSVLNNALLNDPGPLHIDQPEFLPTLRGIFLTVAALELD